MDEEKNGESKDPEDDFFSDLDELEWFDETPLAPKPKNRKNLIQGLLIVAIIVTVVILLWVTEIVTVLALVKMIIVLSLIIAVITSFILLWRIATSERRKQLIDGIKGMPNKMVKKIRKGKDNEPMFWGQPTFWGCIVVSGVIAWFLPSMLFNWALDLLELFYGVSLGSFTIAALGFAIFVIVSGVLAKKGRPSTGRCFLLWALLVVCLIVKRWTFAISESMILEQLLIATLRALTIAAILWWFSKCFWQVGSTKMPAQGGLFRFGAPKKALKPGLYFIVKYLEEIKQLPTGLYKYVYDANEGIYTKPNKRNKDRQSSVPLDVQMVFSFYWPEIGEKYNFPKLNEDGKIEIVNGEFVIEERRGEDILLQICKLLPISDLTTQEGWRALGIYFREIVISAARVAVAKRDYGKCKEDQQGMEDEMKLIMLAQPGNPVYELGLPPRLFDIGFSKLVLPSDMEQAHMEVEKAHHRKEAAKLDAERFVEVAKALSQEGKASYDLVAVLTASGGGKKEGSPMDLDVILKLGAMDWLKSRVA